MSWQIRRCDEFLIITHAAVYLSPSTSIDSRLKHIRQNYRHSQLFTTVMESPKESQMTQDFLDAQQPDPLRVLLIANSQWVEGVIRFQPDFFRNSAQSQAPKVRQ